jgi:hypothetical protein
LKFEDPTISVLIENSYGYPMRSKVNLVKAIGKNGDTISLKATNLINDGFDFPYAKKVGETAYARFDFNNTNSNIKDLLNAAPNTILYDIDAIANPYNDAKSGFMTDSTNLRIGLEIDIPVVGSAKNFEGRDTINNVDFSVLDNAVAAEFKFVAENELPVGITLQAFFVDNSGRILGNLADNPILLAGAAEVDAKGNVTKNMKSEVIVPFNEAKIAQIRPATKMYIATNFSTTQNGAVPVRILSTQNINLKCGIKVVPKF